MTWSEAVDQALCFGWIDGVRRGHDEDSYTIRFTPRKPRSTWSTVNVAKVEELKKKGLMRPAGLAAYERRTDDNTGVYSFERNGNAVLPPEYEERLRANAPAAEYFDSRPPWYRRTAIHLVISAKREETRLRRLEQLIEDSAAGRDIKQLRR
ncbi:MAG TPA: YdeI/OmpD-associated family protein [Thermoleophilaceae bacterium]|nr:YdeI/OmpD-associated family protein [Thermoleophilaceae bacterium]